MKSAKKLARELRFVRRDVLVEEWRQEACGWKYDLWVHSKDVNPSGCTALAVRLWVSNHAIRAFSLKLGCCDRIQRRRKHRDLQLGMIRYKTTGYASVDRETLKWLCPSWLEIEGYMLKSRMRWLASRFSWCGAALKLRPFGWRDGEMKNETEALLANDVVHVSLFVHK